MDFDDNFTWTEEHFTEIEENTTEEIDGEAILIKIGDK